MLDLFTIFTKGGIVLWYFQGTALSLSPAVNSLVKTVLLQVIYHIIIVVMVALVCVMVFVSCYRRGEAWTCSIMNR
jgi:hypothetical protein